MSIYNSISYIVFIDDLLKFSEDNAKIVKLDNLRDKLHFTIFLIFSKPFE